MNSRCFKIHRSYSIVVQFVKGWWFFLALHENSFIFCTNQSRLPKNDCENLKVVSKASVKKWKRIPACNVPTGKTGLPCQTFHCSGKFSTETIQQVLFHLLSNRIFWKLFEHWKQPLIDGELAFVALWSIQQQQLYSVINNRSLTYNHYQTL